jgi:hypothetical protein
VNPKVLIVPIHVGIHLPSNPNRRSGGLNIYLFG